MAVAAKVRLVHIAHVHFESVQTSGGAACGGKDDGEVAISKIVVE